MQPDNTLLIPADFGLVLNEDYDPVARLSRNAAKDRLRVGEVYLQATVTEMFRTALLCKGLEEDYRELIRETKGRYDRLDRRKEELKLLEKHRSIFKPFQFIEVKRAIRAFTHEAQGLFTSARTTSGRLKRSILSTPSANLAPVTNESVTRNQRAVGLAVPLPPPEEMNASGVQEALAAARQITYTLASFENRLADTTSSNSLDEGSSTACSVSTSETSSYTRSSVPTSPRPSSPSSASSFSFQNLSLNCTIINNIDSNVPGLTVNNNGHETSGSRSSRCDPSARELS
ncbi:hypothetical protein V8E55_008068 [Tylopilus felleus]